jgi:DNA-binding CsgD family transcriptional regulator
MLVVSIRRQPDVDLTAREIEVLGLLAAGEKTRSIAD